jgi:hypothetical protein
MFLITNKLDLKEETRFTISSITLAPGRTRRNGETLFLRDPDATPCPASKVIKLFFFVTETQGKLS